jgi:hypothetical protein
MKSLRGVLVLVAAFGLSAGVGQTQKTGIPGSPQSPTTSNPLPPIGPEVPPSLVAKQAQARNDERQKRLEADSDKLLELATQLHTEVGKTDKHILSIDVIKKAEEIERLAHSVKERMRGEG